MPHFKNVCDISQKSIMKLVDILINKFVVYGGGKSKYLCKNFLHLQEVAVWLAFWSGIVRTIRPNRHLSF